VKTKILYAFAIKRRMFFCAYFEIKTVALSCVFLIKSVAINEKTTVPLSVFSNKTADFYAHF
jgi:hypothetical protein